MLIVPGTLLPRREIQLEIPPALRPSSMARKIRPTDGRQEDKFSRDYPIQRRVIGQALLAPAFQPMLRSNMKG